MTNLPSQHPTLSLHLTDATLTPLITSSSSPSHLESLTALATSALTSQTAAQRANLGRPLRIMVEYPDRGPVVLQSYLDPRDSLIATARNSNYEQQQQDSSNHNPDATRPSTAHSSAAKSNAHNASSANNYHIPGSHDEDNQFEDEDPSEDAAPSLVGVVVAGSAEDAREARRAAVRLERVGREFQKEWAADADRGNEVGGE